MKNTFIKNSNDNSASYFDLANDSLKGFDVVSKEIALIQKIIGTRKRILDVGCGTGRHLLYLLELGLEVDGIDSSKGMIEELRRKNVYGHESKIICDDIFSEDLVLPDYDLIILMWNTFNEIALEESKALELLKILKKHLSQNGNILINIDDASKIDPKNFDFITQNANVRQEWKVLKFNQETNTTISQEKIIINENGKERVIVSEIIQRWWRREEIVKFAKMLGFGMNVESIDINEELYLVLS